MAKIRLTTSGASIGAPRIGRTTEEVNPDLVAAQALVALGEQFVGIAKTIEKKTEEGAIKAANDVFASTQVWKKDGAIDLAASIAATEQLIRNPRQYLANRVGEEVAESYSKYLDFNKMKSSAIESADALYYDVAVSTRNAFQNTLSKQGYSSGTFIAATDVLTNLEAVSSKIRSPHLRERLNLSTAKRSMLANIERAAEREGPEIHLALAADIMNHKYDAFDPDYTQWDNYIKTTNEALLEQFYITQASGGGFSSLVGGGAIEATTDKDGNTSFKLTAPIKELIDAYEDLPDGKVKDRLKMLVDQQVSTQLPIYEELSSFWKYDPDGPNNITDSDFVFARMAPDNPIFNQGIDLLFTPKISQLPLSQQVDYLKLSLLKMQNLSGAVPESFKNHVLEGLRDPSRLKYTVMALEDLESSPLYSSETMISKEEKLARRFNISRFLNEEDSIRVDLLRIALAQGLDPLTAKGTVDSWLEADVTEEDIRNMDANMVWEMSGEADDLWGNKRSEFRDAMLAAYSREGLNFDTSAFFDYSGPEIDSFVASLAVRTDFDTLGRSEYMRLVGRGTNGSKAELRSLALNHAARQLVSSGVVPIGGRLRRIPLELAQFAGLRSTSPGVVGRFTEGEIISGMDLLGYKNINYSDLRDFDFLYQSTSAGEIVVSIIHADKGDPARMYKDTGKIWNASDPPDPDREKVPAQFIMSKWDDSFLGNITASEGTFQNFARLDKHVESALDPQNVSVEDTIRVQNSAIGFVRNYLSATQIGAEPGRGYRLGFQNPMRDVFLQGPMGGAGRTTKELGSRLVRKDPVSWSQHPLPKTNYAMFMSGPKIDPATGKKEYIRLTPSKPMVAYLDPESWEELEKQGLSGLPLIMEASEKYIKDNDIEKMSVFQLSRFMDSNIPSFMVINTEDGTPVTDFYWEKGKLPGENLLQSDKLFEVFYGRSASGEESILFGDYSRDRGRE